MIFPFSFCSIAAARDAKRLLNQWALARYPEPGDPQPEFPGGYSLCGGYRRPGGRSFNLSPSCLKGLMRTIKEIIEIWEKCFVE